MKKGQFDFSDYHPLAYIAGAIGVLIGFYTIKVMQGGGLSLGEASYHIGFIWKILIPICCGIACFFVAHKMFGD